MSTKKKSAGYAGLMKGGSWGQGRFCLHALHAMHALELAKLGYFSVKIGVCMILNFKMVRNEVLAMQGRPWFGVLNFVRT